MELTTRRRVAEVCVSHPASGKAYIQDNRPLSETALARCLDDGLRPSDWLTLLNRRVFFWADRDGVDRLLGARSNRSRPRAVLVFDTLRLARRHAARIEVSPINSGSTIRNPPRRGATTFIPLTDLAYFEWRRRRGRLDRIREVTVVGEVADANEYLVDGWICDPATQQRLANGRRSHPPRRGIER